MYKSLSLAAVLSGILAFPLMAQIHETISLTPKGALVEVTRAVRSDDTLTLTAQFSTDQKDYSGEVIYQNPTRAQVINSISLKAGERDFGAWLEDGVFQIPPSLVLAPHSGQEGREVVGTWQATFIAPTDDLTKITLILPQIGPIGRFDILDP